MRKLFGLAVCLALVLALSGCKKSESDASSKKSSGPGGGAPSGPPPGYPGGSKGGPPSGPPGYPGRGPSSDAGTAPGTAQPQPEVMPEPEEPDDHSDDPWYDHEKGKTPAGEGEKKPDGESEKKPAGSASAWEPDKTLLDQLEPYQDVEGYQIRLPKGYAPVQSPAAPGIKVFVWGGSRRPDGTFPSVTLTVVTPPPAAAGKMSVDDALSQGLGGVKALHQEWQQTPAERRPLNGLTFLKVGFQAVLSQTRMRIRGFLYAGQDGGTFIIIGSEDSVDQDLALKLAEAAALTFRKKP